MADQDSYGLTLSTRSDDAAELYRQGVALMLAAWPGAGAKLDAAIAADREFAMAHAARARAYSLRSHHEEACATIEVAERLVRLCGDDREISHVAVLRQAIVGSAHEALGIALDHIDRWPTDVIILSLPLGAFGLLAFSGMSDHDQARVDLCERYAHRFPADDWWFLTYHGWALAENGEVQRGRRMLERAFELNRHNANGVHALAHAMFEGGAGEEAMALIEGWLPEYDRGGLLHGHIAWHAALTALEQDDVERARRIYDRYLQPGVSRGTAINVVSDAASLLWRMDAYGHPVQAERWREVADFAKGTEIEPGHAFIDVHMAMIEAATGDRAALDKRLGLLDRMIGQGTLPAGPVVPAIGRAAQAFKDRDYARCVGLLEPLGRDVPRIGGSGAQREIVEDTLLVAMLRSGNRARARALLERRLARRPSPRDARWYESLVA